MECENDGLPRIGACDSVSYGFMQVGLTPKIECGVDRYDLSGDPQNSLNLKYLLLEETASKPAVAIGMLDLAQNSRASYYGVGTKSFGCFRLHVGYIHADYAEGAMLGCDQKVAKRTYLLGDWMPASENYLALGVYQELGERWALTFTYGFPNDPEASNLMAINVSYTLRFLQDGTKTAE